jgi:hypothetical protein
MKLILSLVGLVVVAIVLLIGVELAVACSFDTDCSPGSRCAKAAGALYGVCMGGLFPGNKYDQQPVYDPLDPNRTTGNTCSFDVDCGPGSVCVKRRGALEGVCLRRR